MRRFRETPMRQIAGVAVAALSDYKTQMRTHYGTGLAEPLNLPSSDVLQWHMSNGDVLTARPSGTEPKIKFYFCAVGIGGEDRLSAYANEFSHA
jgi:phosphoglucomutase